MASRIVIGRILLAADQQLGVEELSVVARANLVDRAGIKVDEDGARHVLAARGLAEEGLEGARLAEVLGLWIRTSIGLETMLEEIACRMSELGSDAMRCDGMRLMREDEGVGVELTAPKQHSQAGLQLVQCGCGRSGELQVRRICLGALDAHRFSYQGRQERSYLAPHVGQWMKQDDMYGG